MTSSQETERVYSYNSRARTGHQHISIPFFTAQSGLTGVFPLPALDLEQLTAESAAASLANSVDY